MAYATLLSLTETLEFVLNPPHDRSPIRHQQLIKSLQEKFSFLLSFMEEDFARTKSETMTSLETKIREMAYEAVHTIESQVSDGLNFKYEDLQNIMEQVDSISAEAVKLKDLNVIKDHPPTKLSPVGSSKSDDINKSTIVGFKDELMAIKERLFMPPSELAIISIVGMGGIGKTTLARTIFDDPKIVSHFDACSWLTVSQTYDAQDMLDRLLKSIPRNEQIKDLGERLYKSLKQKRYLIVIDDVWDIKAWDEVKRFFPRDNIGSRIILTTRLIDVATDANSSSPLHRPRLLSLDDSWKLLRQKVFREESSPSELEEIGKEIAKKCKGLPLALVVIGGLLSQGERELNYWTYIEQNINSALANTDNDFVEILALSYYHLPHQLRACFLYMGVFPEDYKVRKSRLIRLWVAEGFVKPHASKSLEEVAQEYLQDLIDRNLILVCKWNSIGGIKYCGLHDLVRDLCERITQEEKFLRVIRAQVRRQYVGTYGYLCSASIPPDNPDHRKGVYGSQARSLLQCGANPYDGPQLFFILSFQQPRVLDAEDLVDFPFDIVNVRFVTLTPQGEFNLNASIRKLFHLQTLIIGYASETIILPVEIWNFPQLRHIFISNCLFPYPSGAKNGENFVLSKNLRTLKGVKKSSSTKDVLGLLPNLMKLKIMFPDITSTELSSYISEYFVQLHQLEDLCLYFEFSGTNPKPLVEDFHLPSSLRKFSLYHCNLSSKTMAIIGSLPDLQALKLWDCDFVRKVWEPTEGQFVQLKSLSLTSNLKHFKADETSFPSLECLDIFFSRNLIRIPSSIGDIPTLRLIKVHEARESAEKSVLRIRNEQEDMGNENLNIRITQEPNRDEYFLEEYNSGDDEEDAEDEGSDDVMEDDWQDDDDGKVENENGEATR